MPFSKQLAERCIECCEYAYAAQVGDESRLWPDGVIEAELIQVQTAAAMLLEFADVRIIALPGTESELSLLASPVSKIASLFDWLQNLKVALIRAKDINASWRHDGKLHHGFSLEVDLIAAQVERWSHLFRARFGDKPIIITGHSQGGAMTPILAGLLAQIGLCPDACYTFAAPRPGDSDFAKWIESLPFCVYRVEFGHDIVPHVPLDLWLPLVWRIRQPLALDFEPCGQLLYAPTHGPARFCRDDSIARRRRWGLFFHKRFWGAHHHLPKYRAALATFNEETQCPARPTPPSTVVLDPDATPPTATPRVVGRGGP